MDKNEILAKMCTAELSGVDRKAIVKARGLPKEAATSPALLEHVYPSDAGLKEVMGSLTDDELRLLHLLQYHGIGVGVDFFARLYGPDREHYGFSFNERYGNTFKAVRENLIRRGVLLYAEETQTWRSDRTTKLSRLRFLFPPEFGRFLPPLVPPFRVGGQVSEDTQWHRIRREVTRAVLEGSGSAGAASQVVILAGDLLLGKKPFSLAALRELQIDEWERSVEPKMKPIMKSDLDSISVVRLTVHVASALRDGEWFDPVTLNPLFTLAASGSDVPDGHAVCHAGWTTGCMVKVEKQQRTYYRLEKCMEDDFDGKPGGYLDVQRPEAVRINPERVPLVVLEHLTRVARVNVETGKLLAYPDLVRYGHAPEFSRGHPGIRWICEHHRGFARMDRTFDERFGKTVIHENLLIARISDLSLKVAVEKAFAGAGRAISLAEDLVAFPRSLLPDVQRLLKKENHVIKTVRADGRR